MKSLFKTLENSFSFFLLFVAFSIAVSTIFSKGDPGIFSSRIWITVLIISIGYLLVVTAIKFFKKEILPGMVLISVASLLVLYFLNSANFEYSHIPINMFNTSDEALLENDRIMLLEHGFGDTEKLKNYEKATFLYNSEEVSVELNKPLKLSKERKLILTGDGKNFLITRSKYLAGLTGVAIFIVIISIFLVYRQWRQ